MRVLDLSFAPNHKRIGGVLLHPGRCPADGSAALPEGNFTVSCTANPLEKLVRVVATNNLNFGRIRSQSSPGRQHQGGYPLCVVLAFPAHPHDDLDEGDEHLSVCEAAPRDIEAGIPFEATE